MKNGFGFLFSWGDFSSALFTHHRVSHQVGRSDGHETGLFGVSGRDGAAACYFFHFWFLVYFIL